MKYAYKTIRETLDAWDLTAIACFSLFVRLWADASEGVITGILGGIPDSFGNIIEFVPLGKWLFLFAFFFLMAGRKLAGTRKAMTFTLYRYTGFRSWWAHQFLIMHLRNLLILMISCGIWSLQELQAGMKGNGNAASALTFFLHLSMWISVFVLCDLVTEKKLAPCVLLILEGMLYILSVNYRLPYLACGMYVRCNFKQAGTPWAMAAVLEIGITAVCGFLAPKLWERGILERKII